MLAKLQLSRRVSIRKAHKKEKQYDFQVQQKRKRNYKENNLFISWKINNLLSKQMLKKLN